MFWKIFFVIFISTIISLVDRFYFNNFASDYVSSFLPLSSNQERLNKHLFTLKELEKFDGIQKPELYLSLLGNVFDVTKGSEYYGPGKTYNYFIGRDASRGFITGKLEDKNNDHVSDLKPSELRSLNNWLKFYRKQYPKVGKLIGKYYSKEGTLTSYGRQVKKMLKEAEHSKILEELEKQKYPPCNIEWEPNKGSRVWCSNKSGGIEREWSGNPRKLYVPGSEDYRCACIKENSENSGNIQEYEDCAPDADSCYVKNLNT